MTDHDIHQSLVLHNRRRCRISSQLPDHFAANVTTSTSLRPSLLPASPQRNGKGVDFVQAVAPCWIACLFQKGGESFVEHLLHLDTDLPLSISVVYSRNFDAELDPHHVALLKGIERLSLRFYILMARTRIFRQSSESCPSKAQYTALSYCWGSTVTTTKFSLSAYPACLLFESLPETLHDAVIVTRCKHLIPLDR